MRVEVRLAGAGGQGLILAGVILAEAVGVYEDKYVVQTQNYGPEARGGSSHSDVIISDQKIFFPKARNLDLLACLSREAYLEYGNLLREDGIMLLDSFYIQRESLPNARLLPFSSLSREKFGRELFANVILLGTISKILSFQYRIAFLASLKKVLEKRVVSDYLPQNLKALEAGYELIDPKDLPTL